MIFNVKILSKAQLAIAVKQIYNLAQLILGNSVSSTSACSVTDTKWPITLEVMATMLKSGSQLQIYPVTIKMEEYNNKKDNKVIWYSESFYTNNKGYKMCLRVDSAGNGNGKGTHLSLYLYLMKGPHDDELTWPLKGKFEIKLLNQIGDSEHHSKTMTYDDDDNVNRVMEGDRATDSWGYAKYFFNENLYKTTPSVQYLKDDCLFFQVTKL